MGKVNRFLEGFQLLGELEAGGLRTYKVAASETIAKGDLVMDNGSGYAVVATSLANTLLGVANSAADNGSGLAGAINVEIIPLLPHYQFCVQVENDALITQTAIGSVVDMETEDGIDISDTSLTGLPWGIMIDEIDVDTDSIAANTYGHALVHFVQNNS